MARWFHRSENPFIDWNDLFLEGVTADQATIATGIAAYELELKAASEDARGDKNVAQEEGEVDDCNGPVDGESEGDGQDGQDGQGEEVDEDEEDEDGDGGEEVEEVEEGNEGARGLGGNDAAVASNVATTGGVSDPSDVDGQSESESESESSEEDEEETQRSGSDDDDPWQ